MKLTCIILSKREYHQFWSHAKHNCKGHNLLACMTLSSFVFTQQSYPSISFLNCLPIFISNALWTGHTILLVHSSTSELSNTIYLTCFHFIVVWETCFLKLHFTTTNPNYLTVFSCGYPMYIKIILVLFLNLLDLDIWGQISLSKDFLLWLMEIQSL